MNYNQEIWKDVIGFEGLYQVSNFGNILSVNKNKLIYQEELKNGYMIVNLYKNKKRYKKTVHRLVAQAFISNPDNKPQVNHIDSNRKNNHISNLEFCTNKENQIHCIKCGRAKERYEISKKINSKKVNQYDLQRNFIKTWDSILQASTTLGIDNSAISKCCKGKRNKCGDYIWKYESEVVQNGYEKK